MTPRFFRARLGAPAGGFGVLDAGLVVLVALLLRLFYLAVIAGDDAFWSPVLDDLYYFQWARHILAGEFVPAHVFERGPLTAAVLSVVVFWTHGSLLGARIVVAIAGALTASLVGLLGARLFGRPVGLLAGLLYAAAASPIVFDCQFGVALVMMPIVVGTLLVFERLLRSPTPGRAFASGLLVGFAAIAHPTMLAVAPLALCLAWKAGRGRCLGRCVLGLLLPIAPVTAHNAILGHDLVLVSWTGGLNLYQGNNPQADGHSAKLLGETDVPQYAEDGTYTDGIIASGRAVARRALGDDPKPSAISAYWADRALHWAVAHPLSWLQLTVRKLYYLSSGFEIGQLVNLAGVFARWPLAGSLPRWWWLFPLAIAGLSLAGDGRQRMLLLAFFGSVAAAVVVFFVVERFRLPFYPGLCILAARMVTAIPGMLRSRAWRTLALRGGLVACLVIFTRVDLTGFTIPDRVGLLLARARYARPAAAESLLLEALHLDPRNSTVRATYARLLALEGRLAEAHVMEAH